MKLVSFDIGIRNMAYCIFDISNNFPIINSWDIFNLMEEEKEEVRLCNCLKKNGEKCMNKAIYYNKNNYYCKLHTKNSNMEILDKEIKLSKNITYKELEKIINEKKLYYKGEKINIKEKKEAIIEKINTALTNNFLHKINFKKKKACNELDLIEIGKKIKIEFNKEKELESISDVIIENQISPIATRMKTIQGMVAQYFIMKDEKINIEFISSSNKLKYFINEKTNYKENKEKSIHFCKMILEKNKEYQEFIENFEKNKKKDDLADSFLQGIWYLNYKKNICKELIVN